MQILQVGWTEVQRISALVVQQCYDGSRMVALVLRHETSALVLKVGCKLFVSKCMILASGAPLGLLENTITSQFHFRTNPWYTTKHRQCHNKTSPKPRPPRGSVATQPSSNQDQTLTAANTGDLEHLHHCRLSQIASCFFFFFLIKMWACLN